MKIKIRVITIGNSIKRIIQLKIKIAFDLSLMMQNLSGIHIYSLIPHQHSFDITTA